MAIKRKTSAGKPKTATKKKSVVQKSATTLKKSELGRDAADILFDNSLENKAEHLELIGDQKDKKTFKISIADHPLDVYRSPFLLDLSKSKHPEKEFVAPRFKEISYAQLPAGEWLEKIGFFSFWELDKSEIVIVLKKVRNYFKDLFSTGPAINRELPHQFISKQNKELLEQVFFINFFVFLWRQTGRSYQLAKALILLAKWYLSKPFIKDETVWLDSKPQVDIISGKDEDDSLEKFRQKFTATTTCEPTISELLSEGQSLNKLSKQNAEQENYKSSIKEVREKYLESNFTRRGVVLNVQKPSTPWPKHDWLPNFGFFSNFEFRKPNVKIKTIASVSLGIMLALVFSVKAMSYVDQVGAIKGKVLGEAEQAVRNMSQAGDDLKDFSLDEASANLAKANKNFNSAKDQLEDIKSFVTVLAEVAPAQNTFKSGKNIIEMGERLSSAGEYLIKGIKILSDSESDLSLSSKINNFKLELDSALEEMVLAQENAEKISSGHIPEDSRERFVKLKESLPLAIESMKEMRNASEFAVKVLGERDLKRYLFIFQNDNEMRATGGFMGSFALVDFKNGKIEKITLPEGGTYDVRAGFNERLAPPRALSLVASRWEFQDSNWWPDFPTSASNIKWFYEKSGGPTVDGVFAINSDWLTELLKVTGPIELENYGKTISIENYEYELQKSIELEAKDKTKPKKILAELAPKIMEKLLAVEPESVIPLSEAIGKGLRQKDLMMYFADQQLQQFVLDNGYAGQLKDQGNQTDYLSVITTNLSGGKTDNVVRQEVWHRAEIQSDGSVINHVLIERSHFGPTDDFFTTLPNNSYIRVYVPLGSELISVSGFKPFGVESFKKLEKNLEYRKEIINEDLGTQDEETGTKIYQENGKTVFSNWSVVGPGETQKMLLVYKLPFRVGEPSGSKSLVSSVASMFSSEVASYGILLQKQPGRSRDQITSEVIYPKNFSPALKYSENIEFYDNKAVFSAQTDSDKYFGVSFLLK